MEEMWDQLRVSRAVCAKESAVRKMQCREGGINVAAVA